MKWFEIVSILVGGGLLIWVSYGLVFESSIEQPSYEVVLENNHFEIRQYSKIKVIGDNKSNSGNAFRSLFNYINGNNNENKKIPMTAPVIEKNQSMLFFFQVLYFMNKETNKSIVVNGLFFSTIFFARN